MKPVKHWLLLVRSSNLNKTGLDIYAKAALGNQELLFLFLSVSLVLHDYFPTFALYVIPKNMTYLDTDKQTQADLSITEGIYDEYPLYSLFSKTETKNGKRLMLDWITSPLNDISVIRKRQEAIAWQELPELPLDEEELDFIEYYLEYRDQIRRPNILVSLTSAFDRLLRHDAQRYVIKRGVTLTIRLLNQLESLRTNLPENAPLLLKELAQSIQYTIYSSELKEVVELYKKEKSPSSYIIDKYDYLFRCIHLELIRGLLSHIYILDVCRTAHRIAISKGFCCRPEMTEAMDLSITGFVHPFTEGGRMNDWKMTNGNNICILTGSNMAGKSTTLKAITISVWLAHCGLPVPARSMTSPVFDGIYTSINLPDSLRDGRSHFMAEILRIKEVLQKAKSGKRCLIILDEMFRGTNAQDAFEQALNGDSIGYTGFLKVADEYSGTKAANLAKAYAGICYAQLGKYEEAVKMLDSFNGKDQMVAPAILGAAGNCYAQLGQLDKAASTLMSAADKADNNTLSPIFLMQAGEILVKQGKYDDAVDAYTKIKDKYFQSYQAMDIDKYIEQAKLMKK